MKRIIVTVDFSDATDLVIDKASVLIDKNDCELVLLHVCPPLDKLMGRSMAQQRADNVGAPGSGYLNFLRYDVARDEVAHELRHEHNLILDQVNRLRDKGIAARGILTHGKLPGAIIREAEVLKADVVVVGSHCHSFLHKVFSGCIRDSLLRALNVPIYVVPVKHEVHHRQFKSWGA